MSEHQEVTELILSLEEKLLSPTIRCSKKELRKLLAEDFIEFCSSGSIYVYDKNKPVDEVINLEVAHWKIIDFKIKWLSEACVLATYRLVKENRGNQSYSLRSSIWKNKEGEWKMIFHQGTKQNS